MILAKLHRAGELTAVWVPDAAHEAMRDLIRARATAMRVTGKARQHLQGFLLPKVALDLLLGGAVRLHMLISNDHVRRGEVITRIARRRYWLAHEKLRIIEVSLARDSPPPWRRSATTWRGASCCGAAAWAETVAEVRSLDPSSSVRIRPYRV